MRKYIIFILLLGLVASIILGFYLHKLNKVEEKIAFETKYRKIETENIIRQAENILTETSSTEEKTSPNAKIIEKRYYKDCEHIIQEEKDIENKLINKTKEEIQIEYIGWEIQKFTSSEVVVYKEVNDYCDEHYVLKDENGEIVAYKLDKYNNEKELIKRTGIQTKYLPESDIESLKKGIAVYSKKELNQLLEDYE